MILIIRTLIYAVVKINYFMSKLFHNILIFLLGRVGYYTNQTFHQ